jgi:hypothetical protein
LYDLEGDPNSQHLDTRSPISPPPVDALASSATEPESLAPKVYLFTRFSVVATDLAGSFYATRHLKGQQVRRR